MCSCVQVPWRVEAGVTDGLEALGVCARSTGPQEEWYCLLTTNHPCSPNSETFISWIVDGKDSSLPDGISLAMKTYHFLSGFAACMLNPDMVNQTLLVPLRCTHLILCDTQLSFLIALVKSYCPKCLRSWSLCLSLRTSLLG